MPRIAARLFNTPLMIAPDKLSAILQGLGGRIVDGGVIVIDGDGMLDGSAFGRDQMGRVGDRMGRSLDQRGIRPYDVVQNVAIIPVEGTLVHKGAFIGQSSGETSYQGIQTQVMRAARDPEIRGVVFEIDSFGGEAAGAFETADMIAQLSAAKPTMAILTDFALSGGYIMAAPTRQIVLPKTGMAGSIGVITAYLDASQALEKQGLKVTVVSSGDRKADFHPSQPHSAEAIKIAQKRVDDTRDLFAAHVGRYRGDRLPKAAALATEAALYQGADAVRAGLADAVGSANDAFAAFVKAVNKAA